MKITVPTDLMPRLTKLAKGSKFQDLKLPEVAVRVLTAGVGREEALAKYGKAVEAKPKAKAAKGKAKKASAKKAAAPKKPGKAKAPKAKKAAKAKGAPKSVRRPKAEAQAPAAVATG